MEQCECNSVVEQSWCLWKSVVEQCDGTLEQCWWNSGTVMLELCGGTVEQ